MDSKDLVRIGLIVLAGIVLLYLVNTYSKTHTDMETEEGFYDANPQIETQDDDTQEETDEAPAADSNEANNLDGGENFFGGETGEVMPSDGLESKYSSVEASTSMSVNQQPKDCFPKDQLTPAELLPSDANSTWSQVNPAGQGELGDQNFLQAGHHVGVNTVGQTLRNANMQLRSEPPNPQQKVSPWLQSTIEPDTNRKPMEIGGCE
uniref:Minor capsid protein P11 C-terminal conserved region domain-containing protein n=1 Tax=viral metagenome TaxID=1070528 RepID=A0A6C0LW63_9ZZZZ